MSMKSAAIVVAALLFAFGAVSAEPLLLQYKFEKGVPLHYRLEMKSAMTFTMPDGKKEEKTMTSSMDLTQELIEAKADNSYRVSVTIENAKQVENGQEKPFPAMPGPQLMTMLPSGKVIDAQGPEPGPAGQTQMVFPSKPINEGESWEQVGRIQQPIPMETTTKYTLDKASIAFPGGGNASLIRSDMAINSKKGEGGEQVSSTTKGELWFDSAKGRMLRSKAVSNFKFDLPIQVPGMPTAQVVRANLDLDLNIEFVKGK
jgi:hypothetical protein